MIIDAGNLKYNVENFQKSSAFSQEDAAKIAQLLEKDLDAYCSIKQQPIQDISKTDSFDSSGIEGLDASKFVLVRNKQEFELDYSAEKALNNCWFASTQDSVFALYKSCSKVSDNAAADMDKEEFLTYLRENGLDKEICWTGVERKFRGEKNYANFTAFSNYTAALFASLEERIKTDFSGDEQKEQLEILNSEYEKAVKSFVDEITEDYGRIFAGLGEDMPMDKLEESIRQIMNGKRDAYAKFIELNKDYAGIDGTADSWLRRDVEFMTDTLRKAYTPSDIDLGEDVWSENDIIAIGMAGQLIGGDDLYKQACAIMQYKDEENVGMGIAMKWLAAEKITVELNVSDSVKGFIGGLLEKYAKNTMDEVDKAIAKSRSNPLGTTADSFPKLDRNAVYSVVNVMKKSYAESGDEKTAIVATAAFARKTFLEKANSSMYSNVWRYNSPVEGAMRGREYWEGFYDSDSKLKQAGGMVKMLRSWERFADIVKKKDFYAYKSNTSFNTFRSYGTRTLKGPVYGGYSDGKWWGTNLNDLVKSK